MFSGPPGSRAGGWQTLGPLTSRTAGVDACSEPPLHPASCRFRSRRTLPPVQRLLQSRENRCSSASSASTHLSRTHNALSQNSCFTSERRHFPNSLTKSSLLISSSGIRHVSVTQQKQIHQGGTCSWLLLSGEPWLSRVNELKLSPPAQTQPL